MEIDRNLLDWFETQVTNPNEGQDIKQRYPDFTTDDAYRLQFAWMRRQVERGDRLVGYKAAHTSLAIRQEVGSNVSIGSLLASFYCSEDTPYQIKPGPQTCVEPEIAVTFKHDLAGPGVSPIDAMRAIEAVYPAIEITCPLRGSNKRSEQMGVARTKAEGGFLLGRQMNSLLGIDLAYEGVVISVNGEPRRSAAGVEALGHPLNVVAAVANTLGKYGQSLKAGMVLLTGSLTNNVPVNPGDLVTVGFTRIGSVSVRFTA